MARLRFLVISCLSSLTLSHGLDLESWMYSDTNPNGPVRKAWGKVRGILNDKHQQSLEAWEHQARKMYRAEVAAHERKDTEKAEDRQFRKDVKAEQAEAAHQRHMDHKKARADAEAKKEARKKALQDMQG
uniref:Uncharacterized protein n=1 Tax=Alexandrium andersonii TaxID=327968 RepID=A0A7S2H604_9DINO|mmetsp:Transcript_67961/g.152252  ORF Transcript_67961/g.152252 Transcript_67961/m.152252 type:complete len:130 (+) Transcript_67961:74-463(+)